MLGQPTYKRLRAAFVLRNASHPHRVGLLLSLAPRDKNNRELATEWSDVPYPLLSNHLAVLRELKLVRICQHGRYNVYQLTPLGQGLARGIRGLISVDNAVRAAAGRGIG